MVDDDCALVKIVRETLVELEQFSPLFEKVNVMLVEAKENKTLVDAKLLREAYVKVLDFRNALHMILDQNKGYIELNPQLVGMFKPSLTCLNVAVKNYEVVQERVKENGGFLPPMDDSVAKVVTANRSMGVLAQNMHQV